CGTGRARTGEPWFATRAARHILRFAWQPAAACRKAPGCASLTRATPLGDATPNVARVRPQAAPGTRPPTGALRLPGLRRLAMRHPNVARVRPQAAPGVRGVPKSPGCASLTRATAARRTIPCRPGPPSPPATIPAGRIDGTTNAASPPRVQPGHA